MLNVGHHRKMFSPPPFHSLTLSTFVYTCRATMKAVEAAITSRQWKKAVQILEVVEDKSATSKYYKKIAQHYANMGDYEVCFCFNNCNWISFGLSLTSRGYLSLSVHGYRNK